MSLSQVFNPRSIAVIGASHTVGSVGNELVKNLTAGFKGEIYPINPKGGELYGLPVFTNLKQVKHSIDLAVIAVPAQVVPIVLKETGLHKIPAAIVISAGFREVGNTEGEQELVKLAAKYKITLVGPNCLGMMNPLLSLNASFAPTMPKAGSIAFLSQSGALGTAILDYAQAHNLGFSKFLSMGNKAAVDETKILNYLAHDSQTKVILMYIEQMSELHPILHTALKIRRSRHPKPIIVLKSGQTEQGAKAASSHTGALAGSDAYYEALFREAGIIRAASVDELFLYAECFAGNKLLKKDRVAVVTNAGGLGVLVTDSLVKEQLTLAKLNPATQTKLRSFLPAAVSVHNPVDILGDAPADRYAQALTIVAADDQVDAIAVLLTPQSMTEVTATAQAIIQLKKTTTKPILVNFLGGHKVTDGIDILEQNQVTKVAFPEWTAKGLGMLHRFTQWQANPDHPPSYRDFDHHTITKLLAKQSGWLETQDVLLLLAACRIPVARWRVVTAPEHASAAVIKVGGMAVYKILSKAIVHKSEAGGVELNVTPQTATKQYLELVRRVQEYDPKANIDGVLVMEQINQKSQEMLIGAIGDEHLGSLVGCGMGGVFAEVYKDAAFSLVPVTRAEIKELMSRLKLLPILKGARSQTKFDITALEACISRVGYLMSKYPQIAELDINPLFIFPRGKGALVVDARLRCH
jgi:acetate---CoA ligase (ADP-forming)